MEKTEPVKYLEKLIFFKTKEDAQNKSGAVEHYEKCPGKIRLDAFEKRFEKDEKDADTHYGLFYKKIDSLRNWTIGLEKIIDRERIKK